MFQQTSSSEELSSPSSLESSVSSEVPELSDVATDTLGAKSFTGLSSGCNYKL